MTSGTLPPAPFGRVLTAMVTAFHDDGSVDLEGTARVAEHLADHGHDGVVVSGTTGESPTTSTEEDGAILRAVVEAVGDRLQVVAGVGTNNTAHSVELAAQAEKLGADGVLLVTPYYNKPTPAGVSAHFEAVANASGLPVMLYDIPGRTGITISAETYRRVAEHDRIVAVKDAVGDLFRGVRIMQETGLCVLLRRRRAQPRLADPRRRRDRLGRRPRRRRRLRLDGRRRRPRRPGRCARDVPLAGAGRRGRDDHRAGRDDRQGRDAAARGAAQPRRPAARSCPPTTPWSATSGWCCSAPGSSPAEGTA